MATYAVIDAAGITAPNYADILDYLQVEYRRIYGQDLYLGSDSQEGEMLGLFALALSNANAVAVQVYNAFSPSTAQGEGLSRVVKTNGIARLVASRGTVDVTVGGTVGTVIVNGIVGDAGENRWALPAAVTIPPAGVITVTATATLAGAINAAAAAVSRIINPQPGWQTATNAAAATPGAPVETDAGLRRRQSTSTALPSRTVLDGLVGAVKAITGVARVAAYENDTATTDGNGIPAHSLALVVDGGTSAAIAAAIATKKTPGAGTYGSTAETVTDAYGVPRVIRFSRPTAVTVSVRVALTALTGYTTAIGDAIKAAVSAQISALAIGDDVLWSKLALPANLYGATDGAAYDVTAITLKRGADPLAASNVVIAWNEAALCASADVTLVVT